MPPKPLLNVLTADTAYLQSLLQHGSITSASLVDTYLAQIEKHDQYLKAVIQLTPLPLLRATAERLDFERKAGGLRGPLHGIPIIIKDNIASHPDLGLHTTAGSLALYNSKPPKNAKIVDLLIQAGAVILGKANLSELSNYRGVLIPSGWSAVGGQTQSAYVRGGLDPNDSKDGHSSPSGSSSGSAVAVSAGYAPIAIGTETDGSLTCPAGRAALYTLKPTIGLVPQAGIVPVSHNFDSAGPMTKTVYDLAVLLDVLTERQSGSSFTSDLTGTWKDIGVATLDPDVWKFPDDFLKPVPQATEQIDREIRAAYQKIKPLARNFADNVPLRLRDDVVVDGEDLEMTITQADLKSTLNQYLLSLDSSAVRTLSQLIEFNKEHAEQELPPPHDNQDFLIETEKQNITSQHYQAQLEKMHKLFREQGVDDMMKKHNVDVIIGPSDSFLSSIATFTGYPIAQAPLSYLDFNGRPFGVSMLASAGQDAILVKALSAWEETFGPRTPPPLLQKKEDPESGVA